MNDTELTQFSIDTIRGWSVDDVTRQPDRAHEVMMKLCDALGECRQSIQATRKSMCDDAQIEGNNNG